MSAHARGLPHSSESKTRTRTVVAFFLILAAVLLAYGNTFNASWHFDDYNAILGNPILHIHNLRPDTLYKTFFANPGEGRYTGKHLYRPVSCLSFAINWYFGGDHVFGYHVVNLCVHVLAALFIYLCSVTLLGSPKLRRTFGSDKHAIALLSALIWAVHPIQTEAVTYIVQRMASLSAMFGLLSLWLYMVARGKESTRGRLLCFAGCAVASLLSFGAKENGVLIPAGMVLVEILFYRELSREQFKRLLLWSPVVCLCLVVAGMWYLDARGVLAGYDKRDFTLLQRLMTEPRVLLMYIGQLFWPLPGRFSIQHDVLVSRSLLSPWTTLPSLLAVLGLIAAGISQVRRRPLVAFAILFFFLNHMVESTVIPLELAFEHRNYLPTAFVFLPIAQGILYGVKACRHKGHVTAGIGYSAVLVLLLSLVGCTFLRNDAWRTEKRLWEDAIVKAPDMARPYQNLAYRYYEKIGRDDIAMALYRKALTLRTETPKRTRVELLTNIGVLYGRAGDYERAYHYYMEALKVSPTWLKPRYDAAMAMIGLGRWNEALKITDDLISRKPGDKDSNNLKGFILLKEGRPDAAIPYLKKALDVDPTHFKALINIGIALYQTGAYDASRKYLESARAQAPGQGLPLFCLIENRLRADDMAGADIYLQKLLDSVKLDEIRAVLESIGKNNFLVPISKRILAPFIEKSAGERAP